MPFPFLVALGPPLIAWGTRAAATYGLAKLFSEEPITELKNLLLGYVVEQAATRAGLALDPNDPFSDASMAGAVGARIGVPLRSLKSVAMLREDLDGYAAGLISEKSGYHISTVQNVAVLKQDLERVGMAIVSQRLGLPVGVMPGDGEAVDAAVIRERLLAWAKAELVANLNTEVGYKVAEIAALANVEQLAADINGRLSVMGSDEEVTARRLAVEISSQMATGAVTEYQRAAQGMSKRARRQELNRAAQAKFRAQHGNRQKYVPLGMTAIIE